MMNDILANVDRKTTVCFSGHRIIHDNIYVIRQNIDHAVLSAYQTGYRNFLCGGALGFDTLAAEEVLNLKKTYQDIKLFMIIPCSSQASRWHENDRKKYHHIISQADGSVILSDYYFTGCMQNRNRCMVDHSSLCICYMKELKGGTWSTVRYAFHCGIKINNIFMSYKSDSLLMKEDLWNYISISHFVYENVSIVHLSPFHTQKKKAMHILKPCCLKQKKGRKNSLNL